MTPERLPSFMLCISLQLVLRLNSHDYPQLAGSMVVPVLAALWHRLFSKDEF
jgi:hypothetical protein